MSVEIARRNNGIINWKSVWTKIALLVIKSNLILGSNNRINKLLILQNAMNVIKRHFNRVHTLALTIVAKDTSKCMLLRAKNHS